MNALIPNEIGIWIECCYPGCKKWRYSIDYDDPVAVPKKWYCRMNSDGLMNDCSIPECLELDEGEIFIESKFKAGSIVWAKVIGYPWNVGIIDFCPDFECYYWFDDIDTNIPSQYHVTFLAGKNVTRAWVKSALIKSFVENRDPAFALECRVRNKKIGAKDKAVILEGYEIAESALSLSISRRLKKYNFNSWTIVQRLQNQFPTSIGKLRSSTADFRNNNNQRSCDEAIPGPSNVKKSGTRTKAGNFAVAGKNSSTEKLLALIAVTKNLNRSKTDTESSVETQSLNTSRQDDSSALDDTRSINSYLSKDFIAEPLGTNNKKIFTSNSERSILNIISEDKEIGDEVLMSDNEKEEEEKEEEDIEILSVTSADEIIPNSQPPTPERYMTPFRNLSLNKNSLEFDNNNTIMNKNEVKLVAKNLNKPIIKPTLKLKGMSDEKRQRFGNNTERTLHKTASENMIRSSNNKENLIIEESRYLRALSEFGIRKDMNNSLLPLSNESGDWNNRNSNYLYNDGGLNNRSMKNIIARKTVPSWFFKSDERRIVKAKRSLERLSKLSDEEDRRMYKENRDSFRDEIKSRSSSNGNAVQIGAAIAAAGSSKQLENNHNNNKQGLKPNNNYFMTTQNMDDLLTSDEDSF